MTWPSPGGAADSRAGVALSAHLSWRVRQQARRLDTCTGSDVTPLPVRITELVLLETSALLRVAQLDARAGRISAAWFEVVWHAAYIALAPCDTRRRRLRRA